MMVRDNPRFQKHIVIIEQALLALPYQQEKMGRALFNDMLSSAGELDAVLDPTRNEVVPMAGSVILRRESFHKKCRDLGEWLRNNCPNVVLD
jgi:hypothetical protein